MCRGVLAACLVLCLAVAFVGAAPLEDNGMETESLDFPHVAVSDSVAGTPGSARQDVVVKGPAHNTKGGEDAEDPCDMTGSATEIADGEEPEVEIPDSSPGDNGMEDKPIPNMYTCKATARWADIDPSIVEPFNLYKAHFEGNNRGGLASSSEFTVTDCACTCSGRSLDCGKPGSTSYYSAVSTPQQCAQMICHANKFSKCSWRANIVARGTWVTNWVKFNSTVLSPSDEHNVPSPTPAVPVIPTTNTSRPVVNATRPSFSPSITPSPSPSSSAVPPTHEELVFMRAVSIVGFVKDKTCLAVPSHLVADVLEDMRDIDLSQPPKIVCSTMSTQTSEPTVEQIRDTRFTDDVLDNALAGYGESSPLAGDITRHASTSMNNNAQTLIELEESKSLEEEAFAVVVRLFQDNVPRGMQCAPGVPPMETLLRTSSQFSNSSCNLRAVLLAQKTVPTLNTTSQFYTEAFNKMFTMYKEHEARKIAITSSPHSNFTRPRNVTHPSPSPKPPMPEEDDASMEDREMDNSPTGVTVIPQPAPGPEDIAEEMGVDTESMQGSSREEDCDDEGNAPAANKEQVLDTHGRAPGQRPATQLPAIEGTDLPQFGKQPMEWGPRNVHAVVLNQPPELQDEQ